MKLLHLKPSVILRVAAVLLLSGWAGLACTTQSPLAPDTLDEGAGSNVNAQDVIVIDQSELESLRAGYVVSEPAGEITGRAACESGEADDACTAAAQQQLKEEAKTRGFGLVVITSTSLMQTFPPQLSLRGTLHQITAR